jgi:hypothetical protein
VKELVRLIELPLGWMSSWLEVFGLGVYPKFENSTACFYSQCQFFAHLLLAAFFGGWWFCVCLVGATLFWCCVDVSLSELFY